MFSQTAVQTRSQYRTGIGDDRYATLPADGKISNFSLYLGYSGKAVPSHCTRRTNTGKGRTSDLDADWCKHMTSDQLQDGSLLENIEKWFGYRVHLTALMKYEITVALELHKASDLDIT